MHSPLSRANSAPCDAAQDQIAIRRQEFVRPEVERMPGVRAVVHVGGDAVRGLDDEAAQRPVALAHRETAAAGLFEFGERAEHAREINFAAAVMSRRESHMRSSNPGMLNSAVYRKKSPYPSASTMNPDVPISSLPGSEYNDDSTAYCVAVYFALVRLDMKAMSAVPCTPSARLSKLDDDREPEIGRRAARRDLLDPEIEQIRCARIRAARGRRRRRRWRRRHSR